jgi:adenylate cyclase
MAADSLQALALQLTLALDTIRDSIDEEDDPQRMFDDIVSLLKTQFNADACATVLLEETSDDIEAIASIGFEQGEAIDLCREAMQRPTPGHIENPYWTNTLGNGIVFKSLSLGGLVLARNDEPFSEDERALLEIAEKQIDSAIIQARMVWKLIQRNRELSAIYQIDRLRDHIGEESRLLAAFTEVLSEQFGADFVMILVGTGSAATVRSLIDRRRLSFDDLNFIRARAADLDIPQVIPTPAGLHSLVLLAAPFIVGEQRIGAVVIGRNALVTLADHRLLYAMTSQMDSAVLHTRVQTQLAQRSKELETILRIDRIRTHETDSDTLLRQVLTELIGAVSAELGFIMLFSEGSEEQLDLMLYTSERLPASREFQAFIHSVARQVLRSGQPLCNNEPQGSIRSVIAVPLVNHERIIGVFGAVNGADSAGFSDNDQSLLLAITHQVDAAIFERAEQRRLRRVLGRSVDPKALDLLLNRAETQILSGERRFITVLYADLRAATTWSEKTPPEEFVATSNEFFSRMSSVIFKYGGTLDKFVGDQVIGLFGTPVSLPDHAARAARAALEMKSVHSAFQAELSADDHTIPHIGISLCSGDVISGEFGSAFRSEFTALGRAMHLGARICAITPPRQIFVSQSTQELLADQFEFRALQPVAVRGFSELVPVYELIRSDDEAHNVE